jgi:hypothetical protein
MTSDDRTITGSDGRRWTFRLRPEVRKEEAKTHVTLVLETPGEVRIVTCPRNEWESASPDLAELLARSLPGGASRGLGAPDQQL